MRKMRPPKNLAANFLTAEDAAAFLEAMASHVRDGAHVRPLVKCDLSLAFWNPDWPTPGYLGANTIMTSVRYVTESKLDLQT